MSLNMLMILNDDDYYYVDDGAIDTSAQNKIHP